MATLEQPLKKLKNKDEIIEDTLILKIYSVFEKNENINLKQENNGLKK